jgi:hypothetical protein
MGAPSYPPSDLSRLADRADLFSLAVLADLGRSSD